MKKLKIKRKAYTDGTPAVGVVGDEDMSASSLRGDALSAWNAAQTQAEKDKILADANAKKTAKNNATMAAVGNTLNAGSKALGKGDQHSSDVEQGVDAVQDTVASVVPVAGLFHGISEMGQSLGAKIDPKNADKQKYFFEPHRLITDGLIGGEFFGTADWQKEEAKKKKDETIAQALKAQSDVNYVPKMKDGGEAKKDNTSVAAKKPKEEYNPKALFFKQTVEPIKRYKTTTEPLLRYKKTIEPIKKAEGGEVDKDGKPVIKLAQQSSDFKREKYTVSDALVKRMQDEKLRRYSIDIQGKAEGGEVEGAGGPKDDKVKMTLQERSFVVPAENADKAEALRKKYLGKTTKKMKSGGDVPVKLSDGEHVFTPEERDVLESNGVDLTALAPNAKEDDFNLKHGGSVPKGYVLGGNVTPEDGVVATSTSSLEQQLLDKIAAMRANKTITEEDAIVAEAEASNPARQLALSEALQIPMAEAAATEESIAAKKDTEKKNKLLKVSEALGGATGALALAQVGLGLEQTLSGKRPKFKIDSTFLGRIGDALKSEKSGLPEATKTAALNKLDLGRKALTNYATNISGGNTGTAFAAAKEAAGQEAAGIVELASRDAMMQLQKKSRTDSLVSHLQGLKRQAFEDDLNAFSQNQQAGAQLTQAGISNFVGNKQYKDAQDRMDARLAKYGTTGLTTTV